jgi:glc operon protein GlcG
LTKKCLLYIFVYKSGDQNIDKFSLFSQVQRKSFKNGKSSPLTARVAVSKAYTAIGWKRDTKEIQETFFMGKKKGDVAWFGDSRHAPIPGGVLLKEKEDAIAGAVGASGRTTEEDEELARVGEKDWNKL